MCTSVHMYICTVCMYVCMCVCIIEEILKCMLEESGRIVMKCLYIHNLIRSIHFTQDMADFWSVLLYVVATTVLKMVGIEYFDCLHKLYCTLCVCMCVCVCTRACLRV
jgi:hypothetical protein